VLGWVERLGRYADVSVHRSARVTAGVVVYRLDDRLFFANAGYVKGRVLEAVRGAPTPARWLVFDGEGLTHVDSAGLAAVEQLLEHLGKDGVALAAARLKAPIRQRFDESGLTKRIGADRMHPTVRAAVAACAGAERLQPA
jgi:sulfate permease, SulP family